jgi:glycosyltransferase involved in cell wall biosynthesis
MPVRNAAPFLDESIPSILGQTFTDFEFVVLDDASSDKSAAILESWAARDARLRVERSGKPLGLVGSSNAVVRASQAPLVARMDADDVSKPERLARQVALIESDQGAVLGGTLFEGIDGSGRVVRTRDRWRLLRPSVFAPFPHGSILFRREMFEAVGGYDAGAEFWEDLDLYHRLAKRGRVLVLPEALYQYRFHSMNVRVQAPAGEVERAALRLHSTFSQSNGHVRRRVEVPAPDDPLALYSLAASRLWAGLPPELLSRLRLGSFRRLRLSTLAVLAVAVGGAVSPGATRAGLATFIAARDRLAGLRVGDGPVEWHFAS